MSEIRISRNSLCSEGCTATITDQCGVFLCVTVVQLNGLDLIGLLSLYCQAHTRLSTQVFCPIAVTLNQ